MYFILKNNILLEPEIGLREPENLPKGLAFIHGKMITIPVDNPMIFTTNAKAGDAMIDFQDGSFPVMSKRFLEIMKASGVDNLQTFPIIIKSEEDDTIWDNYFIVNILGMIACADLSKSTYDEIMPGFYSFDELAIHAEKAKDTLLFRLQEDPTTIIMHRSVGQYIKAQDPDKTLVGWSVAKIIQ
jgi:hypothetical protein